MTNKKTLWKPIAQYEELYEVSNYGDVVSVAQYTRYHNIRPRKYPRPLKPEVTRDGYARVTLSKYGIPRHMFVHRLVASAFIPNPNNLPQVNHKDENPLNNNVHNLEWCTGKQNCNYGMHRERIKQRLNISHHLAKKIARLDIDGNVIEVFSSINDAARKFGIRGENITRCCKGKYKLVCGCRWKYLSDND